MPDEVLSDLELAFLKVAAGDTASLQALMEDAGKRLAQIGLLAPDSGAVGFGYVLTDAGRVRLAQKQ